MGIFDEAEMKRAAVPDRFRASDAALPLTGHFPAEFGMGAIDLRADIQGIGKAIDDEIAFIEIDGEKAVVEGPQTEAELRNTKARLISDRNDVDALAEKAGVLNRIETTGLGSKEEAAKRAKAENRKANDDARTQMLLALQAQLDALDREIALLDEEIDDILAECLSPEEKAYIDGIEDPEEKAREQMRIMREKLERGEISQAKFDQFKDRWDARAEKRAERKQALGKLDEMKGKPTEVAEEIAKDTVETHGSSVVASVSRELEAPEQKIADTETGKRDFDGNFSEHDILADGPEGLLGELDLDGNALGIGVSVANAVAPDTEARAVAPKIRPHFETASLQTDNVKPDAQIHLIQDREANGTTPLPNAIG